jgi:hypothetical protein
MALMAQALKIIKRIKQIIITFVTDNVVNLRCYRYLAMNT